MSLFLDKLAEKARSEDLNIYNIVERTDAGAGQVQINWGNAAHDCYSIAKTVTSIAIGILSDRRLVDVNDKVSKYLSEFYPEGYDKKWDEVTIEQVFRHRTGSPRGCDFDGEDFNDFNTTDVLHFLLGQPITLTPGKEMVYADGNYYIISRIVEKITGMDLENFLQKELFVPLRFHVYAWSRCFDGHTLGGTGLFCKTWDLAKIGQLYLDRGVYEGKRIFSETWADYIYSSQYKDEFGTSGSIAAHDHGIYHMAGAFGQRIIFSPKTHRVVAYHSYGAVDLLPYFTELENQGL
ncbi:MAG: hypothetical protein DBX47_03525 [Clostridiales bacterium]|nr:MAG: hypothetical protein DBX47_03525 [Clostridiales bacterium]